MKAWHFLAIQIFRDEGPVDWDDLGLGDQRPAHLKAYLSGLRPPTPRMEFGAAWYAAWDQEMS